MNKDEIVLMKAFGTNTNIDEMLIVAADEDDTQEAKRLIEAGADVNAGHSEALKIAVMNNNMQLTKILIEAGVNVNNAYSSELASILKTAIKENNAELFYRIVAYVREITKRIQIAGLIIEQNRERGADWYE